MVTGGEQAGTTYYFNGNDSLDLSYEKTIKANGVTEHKHYISLPGSNGKWLLGQFVQRSGNLAANPASSRAAQEFNYFHQDAQGSTVAVSDANGQTLERMAYDPWGDRRNVTGPSDPNNLIAAEKTDRGYTQHEMLDEVGLVHMNGRIYDPTLGRMLTADILVSYPERSTSFNRYAYALNNPLRFVDPTGWDVESCTPNNPSGIDLGGLLKSPDSGVQSSDTNSNLVNNKGSDLSPHAPVNPTLQLQKDIGSWGSTITSGTTPSAIKAMQALIASQIDLDIASKHLSALQIKNLEKAKVGVINAKDFVELNKAITDLPYHGKWMADLTKKAEISNRFVLKHLPLAGPVMSFIEERARIQNAHLNGDTKAAVALIAAAVFNFAGDELFTTSAATAGARMGARHPVTAVAGAALGGFVGHFFYDNYIAKELRRQWAGAPHED